MKFARAALLISAVVTMATVMPAGASMAPTWKVAQNAALPPGGTGIPQGYLPALSCPSAGDCVAVGDFSDASSTTRGLILNETRGVWRNPTMITPPANAAASPGITPYAVSCGSAASCAIVGSYQDSSNNVRSFVEEKVNGRWKSATQVSLPANALGSGQNSQLRSVDCASAGNCSAVGTYIVKAARAQRIEGLVLDEVRGKWRRAAETSLPSGANENPFVSLGQLACVSGGNCSATGSYIDANNLTHGLILNEVAGKWSRGTAVTLPANANAYPNVSLSSVACASVGNCTTIGTYESESANLEGFTVSESAGRWGRAVAMKMPAGAAANPHVFFYGFSGISCPSAGNCSTGGQYRDSSGKYQGFLIDQVNGTWRPAVELTLPSGSLMAGKNGGVVAMSCVVAGQCSAGAAYLDGSSSYQALTVSEVDGVWQTGAKVTLPSGATSVGVDGGVYGLVCPVSGQCTATGSYLSGSTNYQGFTITTN